MNINDLSEIYITENEFYEVKTLENGYLFSLNNKHFYFNISSYYLDDIKDCFKKANFIFNHNMYSEKIKEYYTNTEFNKIKWINSMVFQCDVNIFIEEDILFYFALKYENK